MRSFSPQTSTFSCSHHEVTFTPLVLRYSSFLSYDTKNKSAKCLTPLLQNDLQLHGEAAIYLVMYILIYSLIHCIITVYYTSVYWVFICLLPQSLHLNCLLMYSFLHNHCLFGSFLWLEATSRIYFDFPYQFIVVLCPFYTIILASYLLLREGKLVTSAQSQACFFPPLSAPCAKLS